MVGPAPMVGEYMRAKVSNNWIRSCSEVIPGFDESTPYEGRWLTEVTGTPFMASARGRPWPRFTPFSTFSPARIQVPDDLGEPAVDSDGIRLAGMPDVHGAKVRTRVNFSNPIP